MRPSSWLLAVAPLSALAGVIWMSSAVAHYEDQTGRQFYGLAAQHYSVPDWKMVYHAGGEEIAFWTVTVPGLVVASVIIAAGILITIIRWRELRWLPLAGLCAYHFVILLLFGAAVAWVGINVTGVFI